MYMHHAQGALLQVLPVQVGFVHNDISYPLEDTPTVTGHGSNGSGVLRLQTGGGADGTWGKGGKRAK
jgi:hypothetical protein